jgi:hypothetical protein
MLEETVGLTSSRRRSAFIFPMVSSMTADDFLLIHSS